MDITTFAASPPTPGTATPGDLYADLQSRTLWLAVDPAVDPSMFVLISDIQAMLAADAEVLVDAKAYTDSKVALLAPKASPVFTGNPQAPTPAAADNDTSIATTAFVKTAIAANTSAVVVPGMWMGWSGSLTAIGTGPLAGWALCNGASLLRTTYPALFTNIGTTYGSVDSTHFNLPDFRDRFLIGGGNLSQGDKNTAADFSTSADGSHSHTVGGTALTVAQLPSHNHGAGSFTFSDTSSAAGGHSHTIPTNQSSSSRGDTIGQAQTDEQMVNRSTSSVAAHTHTVSGPVVGTSSSTGSNATHTHTLTNAAAHDHTVTKTQVRNALNWYAQAYIIRLT